MGLDDNCPCSRFDSVSDDPITDLHFTSNAPLMLIRNTDGNTPLDLAESVGDMRDHPHTTSAKLSALSSDICYRYGLKNEPFLLFAKQEPGRARQKIHVT